MSEKGSIGGAGSRPAFNLAGFSTGIYGTVAACGHIVLA